MKYYREFLGFGAVTWRYCKKSELLESINDLKIRIKDIEEYKIILKNKKNEALSDDQRWGVIFGLQEELEKKEKKYQEKYL